MYLECTVSRSAPESAIGADIRGAKIQGVFSNTKGMTMTKKIGRFRVTDNDRRLRRRDDSEDVFISKLHGEGEEPEEAERDEEGRERFRRGEFVGSPATDQLSPIERFKRASDRKHNLGRGSSTRRIAAFLFVFMFCAIATAQTITPNLQLTLPKYGQLNWDVTINGDLSLIDSAFGTLQLPYAGVWSNSTVYNRGAQVSYMGAVYASKLNGNLNNTPTNTTAWLLLPNGMVYPVAGLAASTGSAWRTPTFSDVVALWGSGSCTSGWLKFDGTCSTPAGGASFPGTNGVVFNTSTSASRNATFSDLVALWASGGCTSGYLKFDGTCSTPSGGGTGAPATNVIYATTTSCANVPVGALCYVVTGNNSTDNSTVFASIASAANSYTQTTVNGWVSSPLTVHFATGTYVYGSGLDFTQPVTIDCEPGTLFNYTGSAHAIDLGPTGLTSTTAQMGRYIVRGCGFIGGASMTDGIFANKYIVNLEFDHNNFLDFGPTGSSSVWQIWTDGGNYHIFSHNNHEISDNGARNFEAMGQNANISAIEFYGNDLANWNSGGTNCASVSGIGLYVNGLGSSAHHDIFSCGMAPAIQVGSQCQSCSIDHNYMESVVSGSSPLPMIQYGDPSSGQTWYSPSTFIDGLQVNNNRVVMHNGTAGATPYFMGPTTSSGGLTNSVIADDQLMQYSIGQEAVLMNANAAQTGNVVRGLRASNTTSSGPLSAYDNYVHTSDSGIKIYPWQAFDQTSWSDSFVRANGALSYPWVLAPNSASYHNWTISSNTLTCGTASCWDILRRDITQNQQNSVIVSTLPASTKNVEIYARWMGDGSTSGTGYGCTWVNGTGFQAYKMASGTFTQLGTTDSTDTLAAGNTLGIIANGSIIQCTLSGKVIMTNVDSTYSTGYPGISTNDTTIVLGPFIAQSLGVN